MIHFKPIIRGRPHSIRLVVTDQADQALVDITDWYIRVGFGRSRRFLGTELQKETQATGTAAVDGEVAIDLTEQETQALGTSPVVVDVSLSPPNRRFRPVMFGSAQVLSEDQFRDRFLQVEAAGDGYYTQFQPPDEPVTVALDMSEDPATDIRVHANLVTEDLERSTLYRLLKHSIDQLQAEIDALRASQCDCDGAGNGNVDEDYLKTLIASVLSNLDVDQLEPGDHLVAVKADGSLARVSLDNIGSHGLLNLTASERSVVVSVGGGVLNLNPSQVDLTVSVSATAGVLSVAPLQQDLTVTVEDGAGVLSVAPLQQDLTVTVEDGAGQLTLADDSITLLVTVEEPVSRLSTSGNQLVDEDNNTVRLRTVNWFGGEGSNHLPNGLWGGARRYTDIIDDIAAMGFNCIRLPFSGAWSNPSLTPPTTAWSATLNPEFDGLTALEILDLILAHCATHQLYVVLDHHRAYPGAGADGSPVQSGYTEADWINTWQQMASRYKDNPTVVGADVHNEPHHLDWNSWAGLVERCATAIHAIAPDWLIFAEGIGAPEGESAWWGGYFKDVSSRPINLSTPNKLVYSPHEYGVSVGQQSWLKSSSNPNVAGWPTNLYAVWRALWGFIYEDGIAPIWIGEFGGHFGVDGNGQVGGRPDGSQEAEWVTELVKYLNGDFNGNGQSDIPANAQGMSFSYWSYNPNSGDTGGLVQDDWVTHQQVKLDLIAGLLTEPDHAIPTGYVPLTASYTVAHCNAVRLTNSHTFSFWVSGLDASNTDHYLLGSGGKSYVYYNGSNDTLTLVDDSGHRLSLNNAGLNDGQDHRVIYRLSQNGVDIYVDSYTDFTAVAGTVGFVTFSCIGAQNRTGLNSMTLGAVYGITLGGFASWPIQTNTVAEFDTTDYIAGNDLTFVNGPAPVTSADLKAVGLLEDL